MSDQPTNPSDPSDRLGAYRPTDAMIDAEWSRAERADLLASITGRTAGSTAGRTATATRSADDNSSFDVVGRAPTDHGGRLRFLSRHGAPRRSLAVPLAACLVVALVGIVLVYVVRTKSGTDDGLAAHSPTYHAPSVTSTPRVGAGQYSYRVTTAFALDKHGKTIASNRQTTEDWLAVSGTDWSYRTGTDGGSALGCYRFSVRSGGDFEQPSQAFFDKLPTDPTALNTYLRNHVSGSSSRDEAVFVAVQDMLITADGLASAKLRAALVSVLSRTGGVTIHSGVRDVRGRSAVRADFVDQRNRPNEIVSLYFATGTYQLLEDRGGETSVGVQGYAPLQRDQGSPVGGAGSPTTGGSPTAAAGSPVGDKGSPAYTRRPDDGASPRILTGPANINVMTSETVVDHLPAKVSTPSCEKN